LHEPGGRPGHAIHRRGDADRALGGRVDAPDQWRGCLPVDTGIDRGDVRHQHVQQEGTRLDLLNTAGFGVVQVGKRRLVEVRLQQPGVHTRELRVADLERARIEDDDAGGHYAALSSCLMSGSTCTPAAGLSRSSGSNPVWTPSCSFAWAAAACGFSWAKITLPDT